MANKISVLALIYPGFNVLDLAGPAEVLGHFSIPHSEKLWVTAASKSNPDSIPSEEGVAVVSDVSIQSLLDGTATHKLTAFDVLVMPGAPTGALNKAIEHDTDIRKLLQAFAALTATDRPRYLLSICTGAGFAGTCGLFAGRTVTTHFGYIPKLKKIVGNGTEVEKYRVVDAGKTESGVRIVTSGGVSCGIDAALYVSSQIYGMEKAKEIATGMDYDWKLGQNEFTEGYDV